MGKECVPGRAETKCKGPEAAVCLVYSRNSGEACLARDRQAREKSKSEQGGRIVVEDEIRRANGKQEWCTIGAL